VPCQSADQVLAIDLILSFLGLLITLVVRIVNDARVDREWAKVAREFDLQHVRAGYKRERSLKGELAGFHVLVQTVNAKPRYFQRQHRGRRKSSRTWRRPRRANPEDVKTRYVLKLAWTPANLTIERVRGRDGRSYNATTRTIETGDEQFDRVFCVRGEDPSELRAFLDPERMQAIRDFMGRHNDSKVWQSRIRCESGRLDQTADRMGKSLTRLGQFAQSLARPIDAPGTDDHLDVLPATPSAKPEVESLLPEVQEEASTEEPVPVTEFGDRVDPSCEDSTEGFPDARTLSMELFGTPRSGHEVMRVFEDEYRGKSVRWSGTVKRVETFKFDSTFGRSPGVRITLELPKLIVHGMQREVGLVVAAPPSEEESLRKARGSTLDIDGVLVKCDPYLRIFFVADAAFVVA
jgi:hypothetical protein